MNENIHASVEVESDSEFVTNISLTLHELQPNQRRRKMRDFAAHFDEIKALIEQGVSYKDIRLALAKGGLSMSAATFKKMFEAESRCRMNTICSTPTQLTMATHGSSPDESQPHAMRGAVINSTDVASIDAIHHTQLHSEVVS